MIQGYIANYSSDNTHKMNYTAGQPIIINFKVAPMVSPKNDPVFENDWNAVTGGTYASLDKDEWHSYDLTSDIPVSGYIKIQFVQGANTYETNYIMHQGRKRLSLFLLVTDLTTEVGFDAILQAV
jgi:hypothetical protein